MKKKSAIKESKTQANNDNIEPLKVLTLIPARGGSKGLPRKNILPLGKKPLIAWSIEYSLGCPLISRTIVSTDDDEIAKIASKYGAEVPFLRPPDLAKDTTPDLPVFLHALDWLFKMENYLPDLIIHLRPTTPLRPPLLIEKGVELLINSPLATSVRSMVLSPITPFKMWSIDTFARPFARLKGKESWNMPRQELPKVYWHNGVIDIIRVKTLINDKSMTGRKVLPLIMETDFQTVDIDSKTDLLLAEILLKEKLKP